MKYLTLALILTSSLLGEHVNAASRPTAEELIKHFNMTQIPQEGPWFALTYRSPDILARGALPERYDGTRAAGSAIIGILTRSAFSALHRLKTDEIWHYYGGDPLQLLVLHPNGSGEVVVLGPDVLRGDKLQYVVPRGAWQGAMSLGQGRDAYSIFGDTLAPGFEYGDFEMGYRDELQRLYPRNAESIALLTRKEFITRSGSAGEKAVESQKSAVPRTEEAQLLFAVDQMKTVPFASGLELTEVVGRNAPASSERCSIAYFTMTPGSRTPASFNKTAEEYFVVTQGTGTVRVGAREMSVGPGSLVVVPPRAEHSLQAASSETLRFYAISAPAFSPDDYVPISARPHTSTAPSR
jgi:uncharacterized protein